MPLNGNQRVALGIGIGLALLVCFQPWIAYQLYWPMPNGRAYRITHDGVMVWWRSPMNEMILEWVAIMVATCAGVKLLAKPRWFGSQGRLRVIWAVGAAAMVLNCLFPCLRAIEERDDTPSYTIDGVTYDGNLLPHLTVGYRFVLTPARETLWSLIIFEWCMIFVVTALIHNGLKKPESSSADSMQMPSDREFKLPGGC